MKKWSMYCLGWRLFPAALGLGLLVLAQPRLSAAAPSNSPSMDAMEFDQRDKQGSARVLIHGRGFMPGAEVRVARQLVQATFVDSGTLAFVPPKGLLAGFYQVQVVFPDGETLCPATPLVIEPEVCELRPVPFEKGMATWEGAPSSSEATKTMIDNLACLAQGQDERLLVLGFASSEGPGEHNADLSKQRAQVVANKLATQLPRLQVDTLALGDALPVKLGRDEAALSPNRRVVIVPGGRAPCQTVRVFVDEKTGELRDESRASLQSQVECFTEHGVTAAIVVVPHDNKEMGARMAGVVASAFAVPEHVGIRPAVHFVYGNAKERAALGTAFALKQLNFDEKSAEVYPIAWVTRPSAPVYLEPGDPLCRSQATTQNGASEASQDADDARPYTRPLTPQTTSQPVPGTFVNLRVGVVNGLQLHGGGALQILREMAVVGTEGKTSFLLGGDLGVYKGKYEYRWFEPDTYSTLLVRTHALVAMSYRVGYFRAQGALAPGFAMPGTALADLEFSGGFRLSKQIELTLSTGAGLAIWKDLSVDQNWFAHAGLGFWSF